MTRILAAAWGIPGCVWAIRIHWFQQVPASTISRSHYPRKYPRAMAIWSFCYVWQDPALPVEVEDEMLQFRGAVRCKGFSRQSDQWKNILNNPSFIKFLYLAAGLAEQPVAEKYVLRKNSPRYSYMKVYVVRPLIKFGCLSSSGRGCSACDCLA